MKNCQQLELNFNPPEKVQTSSSNTDNPNMVTYPVDVSAIPEIQKEKFISYLNAEPFICHIKLQEEQNKLKIIIKKKYKKTKIYYASTSILYATKNEYEIIKNLLMGNPIPRRIILPILKKYLIHKPLNRKVYQPPQGEYYNLSTFFQKLNQQYFENNLKNEIFWSKSRINKRPRVYRLGYYSLNSSTIFISNLLDSHLIPENLLEIIVYHEMVHAFIFNQNSIHEKPHGKMFKKYYYQHPEAREVEKFIKSKEFDLLLKKVIKTKRKSPKS